MFAFKVKLVDKNASVVAASRSGTLLWRVTRCCACSYSNHFAPLTRRSSTCFDSKCAAAAQAEQECQLYVQMLWLNCFERQLPPDASQPYYTACIPMQKQACVYVSTISHGT